MCVCLSLYICVYMQCKCNKDYCSEPLKLNTTLRNPYSVIYPVEEQQKLHHRDRLLKKKIMAKQHTVGIGMDYSPTSKSALRWAAENLINHGDRIILIHVEPPKADHTRKQLFQDTGSRTYYYYFYVVYMYVRSRMCVCIFV